MFFSLCPSGRVNLSDLNADLIETYQQVRDNVDDVIAHLEGHVNSEAYYYALRAQTSTSAAERAARFIYLNITSFNGIYRVNLRGEYNVPYGHRDVKTLWTPDGLRKASEALQGARLRVEDFYQTRRRVREGDLVFLDPPYTVSHNNNGFIKYNQRLFSLADQLRLKRLLAYILASGAFYVMTNAAHETIAKIFEGDAGYLRMSRASVVGGRAARRGSADEYLFTNVPFHE